MSDPRTGGGREPTPEEEREREIQERERLEKDKQSAERDQSAVRKIVFLLFPLLFTLPFSPPLYFSFLLPPPLFLFTYFFQYFHSLSLSSSLLLPLLLKEPIDLEKSLAELSYLGSLLGLPDIRDPHFPMAYAAFFGTEPMEVLPSSAGIEGGESSHSNVSWSCDDHVTSLLFLFYL